MGYFPIPGGFPIVVQGEVVGAIGAGAAGLSGGKDEDCAQNAIKSVFGDGKGVPPSPQPLLATRKVITTAAARALVDACVTYAGQKKYTRWALPWWIPMERSCRSRGRKAQPPRRSRRRN